MSPYYTISRPGEKDKNTPATAPSPPGTPCTGAPSPIGPPPCGLRFPLRRHPRTTPAARMGRRPFNIAKTAWLKSHAVRVSSQPLARGPQGPFLQAERQANHPAPVCRKWAQQPFHTAAAPPCGTQSLAVGTKHEADAIGRTTRLRRRTAQGLYTRTSNTWPKLGAEEADRIMSTTPCI